MKNFLGAIRGHQEFPLFPFNTLEGQAAPQNSFVLECCIKENRNDTVSEIRYGEIELFVTIEVSADARPQLPVTQRARRRDFRLRHSSANCY